MLAVIGAAGGTACFAVFRVLSFLCCSLPVILSLYDIIDRAANHDLGGILDIYPTMAIIYLITLGIVTVLNLYAAFTKGNSPSK